DDLADRLQHELVADIVGRLRRSGGALGVDDELGLAGVVAEVYEDEPTVVAARVDPAGEGHAAIGVVRAQLPAHRVAPGHQSSERLCTTRSSSPRRRTSYVPSLRATRPVSAPRRGAW